LTLYFLEENTEDPLIYPGDYLRMPNDPLNINKEQSDELGYTICPGDFVQNTIPMHEISSPVINTEIGYEEMRDKKDVRENPIPIQYEDLDKESKHTESKLEDTSFIGPLPENFETTQDKNHGY